VRRIGRYILNGLMVLSLVLCVGTVALKARGRYKEYAIQYWGLTEKHLYVGWATVSSGILDLGWSTGAVDPQLPELMDDLRSRYQHRGWRAYAYHAGTLDFIDHDLGWFFGETPVPRGVDSYAIRTWYSRYVRVPIWAIAIAFAALPLVRALRYRGERRRRVGFCARCNYDLRATTDRCPECGTTPAKVKA
jgi:hypothetical protein